MEKIIKIEKGEFGNPRIKTDTTLFVGFIIITTKLKIYLGIEDGQQCCEEWGYLLSEDNLQEYENSEYYGIEIVDKHLETKTIKDAYYDYALFINIRTSKGILQFTAYNNHEGGYGHNVICSIQKGIGFEHNIYYHEQIL